MKYVVWGAGAHARMLMDNFSGLEDCVEVFLDREYDKKMGDIPVVYPHKWKDFQNYYVVICVKNGFSEIYNELIFRFKCKKENII